MTNIEHLKYPIGKFTPPAIYNDEQMQHWLNDIRTLPGKVREAVTGLTDAQLDTPYRPDGWTIRQVVHHIGDSHVNAFIRLKWALTEDTPTIKAYKEAAWASLPDHQLPVEPTLMLLEGLHHRFVHIFDNLDDSQWDRAFIHPDTDKTVPLRQLAGLYAWHGNHHLAHITGVRF